MARIISFMAGTVACSTRHGGDFVGSATVPTSRSEVDNQIIFFIPQGR